VRVLGTSAGEVKSEVAEPLGQKTSVAPTHLRRSSISMDFSSQTKKTCGFGRNGHNLT